MSSRWKDRPGPPPISRTYTRGPKPIFRAPAGRRLVPVFGIQFGAEAKPLEGPSGPTADFTDLHGWAEAYLPGAGWVGFDPTSGLLAGEGHIPLACTPDASSAAPISGLLEPCNTEFRHEMTVQRIYESPRVTK